MTLAPGTPSDTTGPPLPPTELIVRVAGVPNPDWFLRSGRLSVEDLEQTLAAAGRPLDSFESLLDFGCGCGRMLRWMEEVGRTRALFGTDIDPEAVAWCRQHLPFARCSVNAADPPLPYPDAAFDLVFNHSVFTHIDAARQDLWLSELHRVTRPGGFVVLSTHGLAALPPERTDLRAALERDGIVFLDGTAPAELGLPDWYQTTFHAPWYVFEHWGRWFEVRACVPRASLGVQDQVLLERRPDDDPPRRPLAARPSADAVAPASDATAPLLAAREGRAGALAAPSRFGAAGALARRAVLRLLRPYTAHEDRFDDAVTDAIREHERRLEALERRD